MVTNSLVLCYFSALFLMFHIVSGVELTFDLPDSARDCFYEDVKKNTSVVLEYQVRDRKKKKTTTTPLTNNKCFAVLNEFAQRIIQLSLIMAFYECNENLKKLGFLL